VTLSLAYFKIRPVQLTTLNAAISVMEPLHTVKFLQFHIMRTVSTPVLTISADGFDGASKIFLFEFSMPHDITATGPNADMPAIWMLNAQIPRTTQYTTCSCSASGCGEFDLFEVLLSDSPGNTYCKSTVHGTANSGGASNYFYRPSAGTMKAAVVMTGSQAVIKVIDDSYTFGNTLSNSDVSSLQNVADAAGPASLGTVLFKLGS